MKDNNKKEEDVGIFENLPMYILKVSKDGHIIDTSKTFLSTFKYKKKDLTKLKFVDLFEKSQALKINELLIELTEGRHIRSHELILNARYGENKKVLISAFFLKEDCAEKTYFTFVLIDTAKIAEFKEEKKEYLYFLESIEKISSTIQKTTNIKEMMSGILDSILDIMKCDRSFLLFPCDPDTPVWSVPMSRWVAEYPGLTPAENIRMTKEAKETFKEALESREPIVFDSATKKILPPSAKQFDVKSQILTAIHPKVGKPWLLGIHQCSYDRIWSTRDIQLFKEIGNRLTNALTTFLFFDDLKKSEERFRSLIQTAPILIIQIDPNCKIIEFNEEAENLYGRKRKDVLGKDYSKLFLSDKDKMLIKKEIDKILSGETTKGFENNIIDKDGKIHNMSWNSTRLLNSDGRHISIIAVGQDITDKKNAEKDLTEKIKELEKINKIMIGRELKMIELKNKIKELQQTKQH